MALKEWCEIALIQKDGGLDPSAPSEILDKLANHYGGSLESVGTGCRELLGYVGSSAENIISALKKPVDPMTFTQLAEKFMTDVMNSEIAKWFIIIMGLYFVWAILRGSSHWSTRNAVIILPTTGILGTFVGVYYALQHFNLGQLDASIDQIVSGLKIAFTTSILGMLGGIVVRVVNSYRESGQLTKDEYTADDIWQSLQDIRGTDEGAKSSLADINKSLREEGDTSVATQVKLMRQDLNDFAKKIAEDQTAALMEALKDVIRDFNEKMSEQFGENFKQLNVAVGRLLEWQENYKDDLDYLRGAMKDAVDAIENCRASIEKIAEASGSIPDHMAALENILNNTGKQLAELEERLGAFAEIRDKAQEAFPRIEELLTSYTDKLEEAVSGAMESLKSGLEAQNDSMDEIRSGYSKLKEDIETIGTTLGTEVKKVIEGSLDTINASIASAHEAQKAHLETVYNNLEGAIGGLEESYEKLRTDADEASQVIADTIKSSAEEHGKYVREVHEKQIEGMKELEGAYEGLKDQAEASAKTVADAVEENKENLKNAAEGMEKSVAEIGPSIKSAITSSMEGLTASLDDFMRKQEEQSQARLRGLSDKLDETQRQAAQNMEDLMTEQLKITRQSLEDVIGNSVELFDQYLGSIAEQIAKDYRPLMEQMRRVIALGDDAAREAQRRRDGQAEGS